MNNNQAQAAPLSSSTISLVQKSWAKVTPISDVASKLFYERLFELDPSLRPLFKSDMTEQRKKLMQTLAVAVDGLSSLPALLPILEQLGVRHAGYMVQEAHYDTVGQALLWTLQEGLGDEFDEEAEEAWTSVYSLIAEVMKKAAANAVQPKPSKPPRPVARPPKPTKKALQPLGGKHVDGESTTMWTGPKAGSSLPPRMTLPEIAQNTIITPQQGPFNATTVRLVQESWAKVLPISDVASKLFYDRLFEQNSKLRPLFKSDMAEQRKKLMQTLTVAVDGLSDTPKLIPVLQALGARHAGYMVEEAHYDDVGQALLWTLQEGLGDDFTQEIKQAWGVVYSTIASVMKAAAANVTEEALDEEATMFFDAEAKGKIKPKTATTTTSNNPKPTTKAATPANKKPRPMRPVAAAPKKGHAPGKESGPFDAETIRLVQESWAQVMPISDVASKLFYDRLFEQNPRLRPLFKSDMAEQRKKLMQTLNVAVDGLSDTKNLLPILQQLGVRHAGYMVEDAHYDDVGAALLWTLKEGLGDAFSSQVKDAWTSVYSTIAIVMKEAAAKAASTTSAGPAPPKASDSAAKPVQAGQVEAKSTGPFSPATVRLVQESWAKVMPISDVASKLFYDRLFELDPDLRPLFKSDMAEQRKKLMQTLNVAVDGLSDTDSLIPILQQLGIRHVGYMVQDRHYETVGAALLLTLDEGLGEAYTDAVQDAWTQVYDVIASVMRNAANEARPAKRDKTLDSNQRSAAATPSEPEPPSEVLPAPTATSVPADVVEPVERHAGPLRVYLESDGPLDLNVSVQIEPGNLEKLLRAAHEKSAAPEAPTPSPTSNGPLVLFSLLTGASISAFLLLQIPAVAQVLGTHMWQAATAALACSAGFCGFLLGRRS